MVSALNMLFNQMAVHSPGPLDVRGVINAHEEMKKELGLQQARMHSVTMQPGMPNPSPFCSRFAGRARKLPGLLDAIESELGEDQKAKEIADLFKVCDSYKTRCNTCNRFGEKREEPQSFLDLEVPNDLQVFSHDSAPCVHGANVVPLKASVSLCCRNAPSRS